MGSLMAGWDSPRKELHRNSSMTNDEVEKFWKAKKQSTEAATQPEDQVIQTEVTVARPAEPSAGIAIPRSAVPKTQGENVQSPGSGDWWTRSNWAFLNDPPTELRPGEGGRYAPQFDVASRASRSMEMGSSFNSRSSPVLGPS
eukprot:TRINITY_DN2257_c0_g1_i1.p1 TRINITY_DN2257_c0_g1~~TRINITY_DN2257_c0_g1_i1.p1  ORF type:complete len:143 (+),score=9.48 TRINITY_DN2257_c0_g1_i1:235-663(+)